MTNPKLTLDAVPVLSVLRMVMFPGMRCSVLLRNARAIAALKAAVDGEQLVGVFASRVRTTRDPEPKDLYEIGTVARVRALTLRSCCGQWVTELEGLARARTMGYVRTQPFREAHVEPIPEQRDDALVPLIEAIRGVAIRMIDLFPSCEHVGRTVASVVATTRLPEEVPGAVADLLQHLPVDERQRLLETEPLRVRLEVVLHIISTRLAQFEKDRASHQLLH
jgi:ATP-dependent Lon protease